MDAFKEGAKKEVAQILSTFGDWDFFTGESNTENAMAALLNYREDGITPYMLFWKDGLIEEKVVCAQFYLFLSFCVCQDAVKY